MYEVTPIKAFGIPTDGETTTPTDGPGLSTKRGEPEQSCHNPCGHTCRHGAGLRRSVAPRTELPRKAAAAGLASYLTCIWIQQVPADSAPYLHRTAPNGSAELVCELGQLPILLGPQTGPTEQLRAPGAVIVGARLRPSALSAVLGVAGREVVDRIVPLDDLRALWAIDLGETLSKAVSAPQAAAALEAAVLAVCADGAAIDPIAAETVHRLLGGLVNDVADLAKTIGISERQLRRRCEVAIGIAPKPLHRMLRMQKFLALSRLPGQLDKGLAALAVEAGFADQSHLTRECQRLTGRSPGTALREARHNCEGLHDYRASDATVLT